MAVRVTRADDALTRKARTCTRTVLRSSGISISTSRVCPSKVLIQGNSTGRTGAIGQSSGNSPNRAGLRLIVPSATRKNSPCLDIGLRQPYKILKYITPNTKPQTRITSTQKLKDTTVAEPRWLSRLVLPDASPGWCSRLVFPAGSPACASVLTPSVSPLNQSFPLLGLTLGRSHTDGCGDCCSHLHFRR